MLTTKLRGTSMQGIKRILELQKNSDKAICKNPRGLLTLSIEQGVPEVYKFRFKDKKNASTAKS